jgi:hypothetical protein
MTVPDLWRSGPFAARDPFLEPPPPFGADGNINAPTEAAAQRSAGERDALQRALDALGNRLLGGQR